MKRLIFLAVVLIVIALTAPSMAQVVVDSFDDGIDGFSDDYQNTSWTDYSSAGILPIDYSSNTRTQNVAVYNYSPEGDPTFASADYSDGKVNISMLIAEGHMPMYDVYKGSNAVGFTYYPTAGNSMDFSGFSGIQIIGETTGVNIGQDDDILMRIDIGNAANTSRWATKTFSMASGDIDSLFIDFTDLNYYEEDITIFDTVEIDPYALDNVSRFSVSFLLNNFDTLNGAASFSYEMDQIALVPEPATMAILGLGGLLLRKKRSA